MPFSTATIAVPHPARYLRLLTARLEREASVERAADGRATITSGHGTCVLTPALGLDVIAAAADGAALAGLRDILTRHLRRCAGGEDPEIAWTEPVSGADMQIIDPVISDYLLRHCTGADGRRALRRRGGRLHWQRAGVAAWTISSPRTSGWIRSCCHCATASPSPANGKNPHPPRVFSRL